MQYENAKLVNIDMETSSCYWSSAARAWPAMAGLVIPLGLALQPLGI